MASVHPGRFDPKQPSQHPLEFKTDLHINNPPSPVCIRSRTRHCWLPSRLAFCGRPAAELFAVSTNLLGIRGPWIFRMIQSGSKESERTEGISATGGKRACDSCFKRKVNQSPQLHILQLLHLPHFYGVSHRLTSICPSPSVSVQSNVSLTLIGKQIQCLRPDPAVPCSWCDHRGVSCTLTRVSKYQKTKKTSLLVYPVLSHAPTIILDESYLTACPFRDSFSSAKSITEESFSRRLQKIEDTLARTLAYQKTNTEVTTCAPTPVDTPPLPVPIPEGGERAEFKLYHSGRNRLDPQVDTNP